MCRIGILVLRNAFSSEVLEGGERKIYEGELLENGYNMDYLTKLHKVQLLVMQ